MTKENKKTVNLSFIGLILTSLGILIPIIYSQIEKRSKILIEQKDLTTIISKPTDLDSLQMFYKNQQIDNLSKLNLKLTNDSNLSIIESDFITPLFISISEENHVKIISYEIDNTEPKEIKPSIKIDSSRRQLKIVFDLLNPDDQIDISVLFTGKNINPKGYGRIKGIKKIQYTSTNNKGQYILSGVVLFFTLLSILFLFFVERERRLSSNVKNLLPSFYQHMNSSFEDYSNVVETFLSYFPDEEKEKIINKIKGAYENKDINNKSRYSEELIRDVLDKNIELNQKARLIGSLITLIGIIYLAYWIINNYTLFNGI